MQPTQPFLVYRDRTGVASEIEFLRRQYIGFTRLHPVWTGRTLLPGASRLGEHLLRIGGNGLLGPAHRWLFRYLGRMTPVAVPNLAPVLHAQFARGGALALPLVRALGLRMIVTLHGGDVSKRKNWHGTLLGRRWPAVLRYTERFVCVSNAVAEIAIHRGVPPEKLIILPIGVELPDHPPVRHPTTHMFVGRFVEKKGIAVLIQAIRQLRAAGDMTPIVCVGDGPLRPSLAALASEFADITLTGWLPAEAVRTRMTTAFCLLVPSIVATNGDTEGLPSVIPEAMAQGCPAIGSDHGGIAEAIRHEQTGLLVPAGDATALATAMRRITAQSGFSATLGAAAYQAAKVDFNARIQSEKLEALLLGPQPPT